MEVITDILGNAADPEIHAALHRLEHAGAVDTLTLARADLARRRLRQRTDGGADVAVALPRERRLEDGAVLRLDEAGALVVRVAAESWLRLRPADAAAALRTGYHAGNLHWRVRFEGGDLLVALEGPEARYRDRLADLEAEGAVAILGEEAP
jgi:urease accessory protein